MLLSEADSVEQVAELLKLGDEELQNDIDAILEIAKRKWERGEHFLYDDEPHNVSDIVSNDDFIDKVILASPARYDLNALPREKVANALESAATDTRRGGRSRRNATHYGPFYIDDQSDWFSYELANFGTYIFKGSLFPKEAEFIPPEICKEFWASLEPKLDLDWNHTHTIDPDDDNTASGQGYTSSYLCASEDDFREWCRDVIADNARAIAKEDPAALVAMFSADLKGEDLGLATNLEKLALPQDDLFELGLAWYEDEDKDEVLETIREHVSALKTGDNEQDDVVLEFSKADIADMGIRSGVLFEEAPWRLIRLRPNQLRLEGTLMGHCVGKRDMGYIRAVRDKEIEVWSLRSRSNKPRFTLEVDAGSGESPPEIKQLKGKGNRTPGYADTRASAVKFPDEVIFWTAALRRLGIDPHDVSDFRAFTPETPAVQPNGEVCTGFDLPYRRLVHNKRTSRRASKRTSRKTSRRRTSRRTSRRR